MKALVLSVTAGQGHHSCGKAVCDYFNANGVHTEMLDTLHFINPIISDAVANGYLVATEYSPPIYGGFYRLAEKRTITDRNTLAKFTSSILKNKLEIYINEMSPDIIICTHVFSAHIISHMHLFSKPITVGIVTDFTTHPFWEGTTIDYYVTASALLNYQMQKKGIPVAKILPLGIPIKQTFASKINKQEARRMLGIHDKTTILLISGSMGYGNLSKSIKAIGDLNLDRDLQILAVCGNNAKAKREIDEISIKYDIYNYGYVNNVDVMMDASDCIITKPGGITTSEALAKGLPLILTTPIPGQENRNAEFLLNNGIAMMASATTPLEECIYQLLCNKERYAALENTIRYYGKPNATADLFAFLHDKRTEYLKNKIY